MPILNIVIFDFSVLEWLIALAVLLISFGLLHAVKSILLSQIKRFSQRSSNAWHDFSYREVSQTRSFFILIVSLYLGSLTLPLLPGPHELVKLVMEAAVLLQVGIWGLGLIDFLVIERPQKQAGLDASSATTRGALKLIAQIVLWTIIVLILLENIPGVQVTSLIASLGITGVAVALAVQRILSDLFASISIVLDKPFVLGDFITVDQLQGTVEKIGLKSTRLRSLDGEQLIFSNSDLLNSRIHNYQRMERRRVQFTLRISLNTPVAQLAEIPQIIQSSISGLDGVTFGRAHFKEIGATAYLFDVVFYVDTPEYSAYMDQQQAVNLHLLQHLQAANIQLGA